MSDRIRPQLYFAPGSSSLAPHIALYEANAAFEAVPVILADGEQRRPEYLAINPLGRVPALVLEGGAAITEVIGILAWVAHQYPGADLLPLNDPAGVGRAFSLLSRYATTLAVNVAQIWRTGRFTMDEALWPGLQAEARERFEAGCVDVERSLAGEWFLGDRYSIVDPYALVLWRWGQRLGFPASAFPAWRDHADRMRQRPAVEAALKAEESALSKTVSNPLVDAR